MKLTTRQYSPLDCPSSKSTQVPKASVRRYGGEKREPKRGELNRHSVCNSVSQQGTNNNTTPKYVELHVLYWKMDNTNVVFKTDP